METFVKFYKKAKDIASNFKSIFRFQYIPLPLRTKLYSFRKPPYNWVFINDEKTDKITQNHQTYKRRSKTTVSMSDILEFSLGI